MEKNKSKITTKHCDKNEKKERAEKTKNEKAKSDKIDKKTKSNKKSATSKSENKKGQKDQRGYVYPRCTLYSEVHLYVGRYKKSLRIIENG